MGHRPRRLGKAWFPTAALLAFVGFYFMFPVSLSSSSSSCVCGFSLHPCNPQQQQQQHLCFQEGRDVLSDCPCFSSAAAACPLLGETISVWIDHLQDEKLVKLQQGLFMDETFSVGLGLQLVPALSALEWTVRLGFSPIAAKPECSLDLVLSPLSSLDVLYASVRSQLVQFATQVQTRAPLRPALSLAAMIVWTGSKPAPLSLLAVAESFAVLAPVTVLVLVDSLSPQLAEGLRQKDKIRVVRFDNLSQFIHTRAAELVPEIVPHEHYALGWNLCDFRWLFGAVFESHLVGFSHWAWIDGDAFASPLLFGSVTDFGRDFQRHDVLSVATSIYQNGESTSDAAFVSGTFTAVVNTPRGRNFFRHTPLERLVRGLKSSRNGYLDEVITSNAVLSADKVTVALIGAQSRSPQGAIQDVTTGRLYYVVWDQADALSLEHFLSVGRVGSEALASVSRVSGRFAGLLAGQHMDNNNRSWPLGLTPPLQLVGTSGMGFASMLRAENGNWFARPLPPGLFARSKVNHLLVRIELPLVHTKRGGPCRVWNVSQFDWTTRNGEANPFVDRTSRACKPFLDWFRRGPPEK